MDEEKYKELALDYKRWVKQAWFNKFVGDSIYVLVEKAQAHASDINGYEAQTEKFINNVQKWGALSEARALYYGLAIENACKARQIDDGYIKCNGNTISGLRTDHNIEQMAVQLGVKSPSSEPEFLKLLTYQLQTLAKYPIAKSRKKQKEFTGRALGGRLIESQITNDIIMQILKHNALIKLYQSYV